MLQEKLPPLRLAAAPSQVTEDTPDRASETEPETVTVASERVVPSAGEVTASVG
jgi:hypothetical protein